MARVKAPADCRAKGAAAAVLPAADHVGTSRRHSHHEINVLEPSLIPSLLLLLIFCSSWWCSHPELPGKSNLRRPTPTYVLSDGLASLAKDDLGSCQQFFGIPRQV
jgi:hypothetical protein